MQHPATSGKGELDTRGVDVAPEPFATMEYGPSRRPVGKDSDLTIDFSHRLRSTNAISTQSNLVSMRSSVIESVQVLALKSFGWSAAKTQSLLFNSVDKLRGVMGYLNRFTEMVVNRQVRAPRSMHQIGETLVRTRPCLVRLLYWLAEVVVRASPHAVC